MIRIFSRIWPLMSGVQKRRLLPLLVLILVSGLLELAGVASVVPFLAVLADPEILQENPSLRAIYDWSGLNSSFAFLQVLGMVVFGATMLSIFVRAATLYTITHFVRGMAIDLGVARLRRFLAQPYEWFLSQHSSDLGKSVLEEVQQIVTNTITPAVRSIANILVVAVLVGFLLYLEPLGALSCAVLLGAGFGLVYAQLRRKMKSAGHERRDAVRERFMVTTEAMTGIKDVKLHGLEESYVQRFLAPSRKLSHYIARSVLFSEMPRFALEAMAFGGILLFLLYLLWAYPGGMEDFLPIIGAFAFAGLKMMPVVQTLFRDLSLMRFGDAGMDALIEDMQDYKSEPEPDVTQPIRLRKTLELRNVSYRYPGAPRNVVDDISLEIAAGKSVGFVGSTGAGKTTVVDILLGLLVPHSGTLLVDGKEITGDLRRAWQRGIGYVPQSIYLTHASIAQNIAFGVPPEDIDQAKVEKAARLANVEDFVATLDDGYETQVGENGVRLSGGQRQRIGIARALYHDPDVVVFDEATSALDTVVERAVIEAVRRLEGTKTVLMITHRLSTVAHCDQVVLIKHGQLAASGDYQTLKRNSADFRELLAAAEQPEVPVG